MKLLHKYIGFVVLLSALFLQNRIAAQAPANDNICSALPLTVGLSCKSFTNVNSTNSPNPSGTANPSCWAAAPSNDVWVSFVATAQDMSVSTDVALFELIPSGANLADTEVAVYSSSDNTCSGTLTLVGCDEDAGINSLLGATTLLSIAEMTGLVVGNTYFIRIDGNGTSTGAFCLSVFDTYTPGSKPCEAHIVHPNNSPCDTLNGNKVVNATSSNTTKVKGVVAGTYLPLGQDFCGADNETAQYGTWTTFEANSNGDITITNFAPTPVDYTLFSGNCANMTCMGSQQAAIGGNTIFTGITSGTTYFILTTLQGGAATDAVTTDLCVSNNVPQLHPPSPKYDGTGGFVDTDSCEIAYGVTVDRVYQTTNYGAKNDGGSGCKLGKNVWFYWDVPPGYPAGPVFFQIWNKNCTGGPGNPGIRLIVNPSTSCTGGMGCQEVTTPKSDQNTNVGWDSGYSTRYYLDFAGDGDENCDFNFMVGSLPIIPGVKVNSVTICEGESANLTAFNAYEYSWSTGETTASITVAPPAIGVYEYTVTAIKGASGSDVAKVTMVSEANCPTGPVCAKTFTTQGTFTWTAPACVNSVDVECWGGGGAGGGTKSNAGVNSFGGGGGGGAYTKSTVSVTPGTTYTVVVAAAALGGTGNGPNGNVSTFSDGNTILVTGAGGKGGTGDTGEAGLGGVGTYNGGNGAAGCCTGSAGGGGGGAGSTGAGANALSDGNGNGGAGGTGGGGTGGTGGKTDGSAGLAGAIIGGGGGGADAGFSGTPQLGGNGASGKVTITCSVSSTTVAVNSVTICSGQTATLTASGASTYSWSSGSSTTNTLTVTPTSTTSYSVSGAVGACSNTAVGSVTVINSPTVTVNDVTVCSGGNVILTASGATDYVWTPGATTANPLTYTAASNATYTVIGTSSGCSDTAVANVTIGGGGFITVNSITICNGQSSTLTASGGSNYDWAPATGLSAVTGASVSANPTTTTTYTVSDNSSGCSTPGVATVTVNDKDNATFSYSPATVCKTGGADPTPDLTGTTSGGMFSSTPFLPASNFNPSSGVITLSLAPINTYTVTYTTAGVCPDTSSFKLAIVSASDATFNYAGPYCQNAITPALPTFTGGSAGTFDELSGNLKFVDDNTGEINLTTSAAGTYTVSNTIAASGSCLAATYTNSVTIDATPVTTVNSPTICSGSSATLQASGATNYSWSNSSVGSSISVNTLTNNTYTVTGSIGNCSSIAVANVTTISSPTVTVVSATICTGQTGTITANGANSYQWSLNNLTSAAITDNPTQTTTYTVTGTIATCSATATGTITVNNGSAVTVNNATICNGQTATLEASGGATYTWLDNNSSTNPRTVNPTITATYTVSGGTTGCLSAAVANVTVIQYPVIIVNPATVCSGSSATLTASGGTSYIWSNNQTGPSITVNPTSPTNYTVTENSTACQTSQVSVVSVNTPPTITVNSATICSGQTTTLTASGASSYKWSTNATTNPLTVKPTSTTTYTVIGNPNGCPGQSKTTVVVNITPTLSVNSYVICVRDTAILIVEGADTYTWMPSTALNTTTGTIVKSSPSGIPAITYTVTGTAFNGCKSSAESIVYINKPPKVDPGADITIAAGASVQLNVYDGNIFAWNNLEGLSCYDCPDPIATPSSTSKYCVTVTNTKNCVDSSCVNITVNIPCPLNPNLTVPNAFSPNNDGSNDLLILHGWEQCVNEFKLAIFDRWGTKVFESDNPMLPWDGTYKGKPLNSAVFVYFIDAILSNNQNVQFKGNITLIK